MLFIAGKEGDKIKFYTRLADFDTLGNNPVLPSFWYAGAAGQKKWKEVKTPLLESKAALLENITIFQTGEGNSTRELRIEGLDQAGRYGYYRKMIDDDEWEFRSYSKL